MVSWLSNDNSRVTWVVSDELTQLLPCLSGLIVFRVCWLQFWCHLRELRIYVAVMATLECFECVHSEFARLW